MIFSNLFKRKPKIDVSEMQERLAALEKKISPPRRKGFTLGFHPMCIDFPDFGFDFSDLPRDITIEEKLDMLAKYLGVEFVMMGAREETPALRKIEVSRVRASGGDGGGSSKPKSKRRK